MAALTARVSALPVKQNLRQFSSSTSAQRALGLSLNSLQTQNEHAKGQTLRMIMFGKPGAGKGTLSSRLVQKYDILSLSTGDLLRQHITEGTQIGRQAEEIVAKGGLLPDDVVLKVVTSKLESLQNKHWILDGFPRTIGQAKLLDTHLRKLGTPLSLVVNLDVPDEVILSRISDRWVHSPSGRVYNMSYNKPKVEGLDDITGEPLTRRPDDNPEVFSRRLAKFYEATSPLLSHYDSISQSYVLGGLRLATLSGTTSDEIWPKLERVVTHTSPALKERTQAKKKHNLAKVLTAGKEHSSQSFADVVSNK